LWTNKWILENFLIRPVKKVGVRQQDLDRAPEIPGGKLFFFYFYFDGFFFILGLAGTPAGWPSSTKK